MATPKSNVVQYEFQGNILPLEKAFAQVGKLFRRYIKEAKEAAMKADPTNVKGKLGPDEEASIKTMKHYYKRLKVFSDKAKQGIKLTPKERQESAKIYKELLRETVKFADMRNKIRRDAKKEEKKQEEAKREVKDWTATSSQFRVGIQADEMQLLMRSIPTLPANIKADINSYIEAWTRAREELARVKAAADGTEESQKQLQAATKDLSNATKNLNQKAREYIPTLKEMMRNQQTATNGMERIFTGLLSQITSLEFWIRKIKEGVVLLGDFVESLNFVDVAIGNIKWTKVVSGARSATLAINEFKDALENARWSLGLNATDVNTAAATYISYANAMNFAGKSVLEFSQNMTQLSIDMASLYNKDTIVMMTALRSALAGNTRAMMNYGISVHDATLNEWMLSKGLNKTMNTLSESSQVLVRYLYIMEKTTAAQGDLQRTLKSPANQLRMLSNQAKLLTQNLGALFNLVIYPAIRILNAILEPLNAFLSALTAAASDKYSGAIGTTADSFDDLAESIDDTASAAKGLSGLDEINQMTDAKSNVKIGIDADIQALVDAIGVYEGFADKTSMLTDAMWRLGDALSPIWSMLADSKFLDYVGYALEGIGVILQVIVGPLKWIKDLFTGWYEVMPQWLKTIFDIWGNINSVVAGFVATVILAVAAVAALKTIMNISYFKTFIAVFTDLAIKLKAVAAAAWEAAVAFEQWLARSLYKVVSAIQSAIVAAAKWIASMVKMIAMAIKNAVATWIQEKAYWKLAIAIIAAMGVAALVGVAIVGAAVASANSTKSNNESKSQPHLAKGGVVTGPTFALIGEGAYNEAVIPLGNSPQMKELQQGIAERVIQTQNTTGGNSFQGSGGNATVQLNIDGRSLGRASINNINRVRRQVGVDIK
jgi:hypothetical protein